MRKNFTISSFLSSPFLNTFFCPFSHFYSIALAFAGQNRLHNVNIPSLGRIANHKAKMQLRHTNTPPPHLLLLQLSFIQTADHHHHHHHHHHFLTTTKISTCTSQKWSVAPLSSTHLPQMSEVMTLAIIGGT